MEALTTDLQPVGMACSMRSSMSSFFFVPSKVPEMMKVS